MLKTRPLYSDKHFDLLAVEVDGECFVRSFIDGLNKSDKLKISRLLESTAKHGTPNNTEKFKKLHCEKMDVYEFKSKPYRILCTIDGGRKIILSHGCRKTKPKEMEREINKAVEFFEQYFKGKQDEKRR